jgi:hypothetical protein
MSSQQGPLRRIVNREGSEEILECGHRQQRKPNAAMRRRCRQCIEIRRLSVTLHERTEVEAGQRCPFCFDLFEETVGDPTRDCPRCHTRLHAECWEEHGGCTALGCRGATGIRLRPREPQPAEATNISFGRFMRAIFRDWRRSLSTLLVDGAFPISLGTCLIWDLRVAVIVLVLTAVLGRLIRPRPGR